MYNDFFGGILRVYDLMLVFVWNLKSLNIHKCTQDNSHMHIMFNTCTGRLTHAQHKFKIFLIQTQLHLDLQTAYAL